MKKILIGLGLMFVCALALAIPTPGQIEDALSNKNYPDAKSMVQQVLREKPDSARAHLLNAYLLVHVDKNKTAANAELQTAVGLDKKGDVKSSALFGRVVAEIDMAPAVARAAVTGEVRTLPPETNAGRLWIALVILFWVVALSCLIIWILRQRVTARPAQFFGGNRGPELFAPSTPHPASPAGGGAYFQSAPVEMVVRGNQSMGALGTAASVAGGVVAGNVLSDALLHRRHSHSSGDSHLAPLGSSQESAPSTYSEPSPVSYQNGRSACSSGSDSSWGSSDSSSSSSSDSGSSWD